MARSFVGTVLGGPLDGEILTCDRPTMQAVDPVVSIAATFSTGDGPLPFAARHRVRLYHWTQDDDGRGWWLERPTEWTSRRRPSPA